MPSRSSYLDHLATVPLFSGLSKRELQEVARAADEIDVAEGSEIVSEGRTGHEFFLIIGGNAVVKRGGRRIATLGPGQYFGELAILDRGPRSATVVAASDMRLLVLGQREFSGLLETLPGIAAKLLRAMAQRLREADTKAVN
jgi:CRP/FNR family cyclic AMP-dependent transcriptional regulator